MTRPLHRFALRAHRRLKTFIAASWMVFAAVSKAQTLTTIYAFEKAFPDLHGENPGPLTAGADGNLYGTTVGGTNQSGTIFQITPGGALTTLYTLAGFPNGANPVGALVQYTDGSFYGVTKGGGPQNAATTFRLGSDGTFTSFGALPELGGNPMGLVLGSDGNLYGTTQLGGNDPVGQGIFYRLTPAGVMTVLHIFGTAASPHEGINPSALVMAPDGNFYGTTNLQSKGGSNTSIFRITPAGDLTILVGLPAMTTNPDGTPATLTVTTHPLTVGSGGTLYGVGTFSGISADQVFRVDASGKITVLTPPTLPSRQLTFFGNSVGLTDAGLRREPLFRACQRG